MAILSSTISVRAAIMAYTSGLVLALMSTSALAATIDIDLEVGTGATATYNTQIVEPGADTTKIHKTGAGTLIMAPSTANSYTGGTYVDGGTLRVGDIKALPASSTTYLAAGTTLQAGTALTFDTRIVRLNGASTFDLLNYDATITPAVVGQTYALTVASSGGSSHTLTLGAAATGSGGFTINPNAILGAKGDVSDPLGTGTITLAGGTLTNAAASAMTLANNVVLSADSTVNINNQALTLQTGVVSGTSKLSLTGASSAKTVTMSGTNTNTGGISVGANIALKGTAAAAFGASGTLTTAASSTIFNDGGGTMNSFELELSGATTARTTGSSDILTFSTVTGAQALTVTGAGKTVLSALKAAGTALDSVSLDTSATVELGTNAMVAGKTITAKTGSKIILHDGVTYTFTLTSSS